MDTRLDYRISCLLSIFRREFDDVRPPSSKPSTSTLNDGGNVNFPTADLIEKKIDLDEIGLQAEAIFESSAEDDLDLVMCN